MSPRFEVTVWPPFARTRTEQSWHVRDNQTGGEVLGRWTSREDAQEHADRCNEREQGITREHLDELKAGILALAGLPADTIPFGLGPTEPFTLPPWPPHMTGCWYERGKGWGRYGPDGRETVPAEVIADAGLPAALDLPDGLNVVFLTAEPFRNLVPRSQP
jgi:hypothetical protein